MADLSVPTHSVSVVTARQVLNIILILVLILIDVRILILIIHQRLCLMQPIDRWAGRGRPAAGPGGEEHC